MIQTLDFSLDTIGSVQKKNLETDFMASWNSIPLEITYQVLGWTGFTSWTIGFYPQVILNFRQKRYYFYKYKVSTIVLQVYVTWF